MNFNLLVSSIFKTKYYKIVDNRLLFLNQNEWYKETFNFLRQSPNVISTKSYIRSCYS